MELQAYMLCNAAHARDGLLSILGGGIDYYDPPAYPANLSLTFAAMLELDDRDQNRTVSFAVVICDAAGERIGSAEGGTFTATQEFDLGATSKVPIVVPLSPLVIPEYGDYEVRFVVDDLTLAVLPLRAIAV